MKTSTSKILVLLEVVIVAFAIIPLLTLAIYRLFPQFETWQTATLGFPFPVFVYVIMMAVSVLAALVSGRGLAHFGMTVKNPKYHLDIAATCFIPVVLANLPFGMGVDYTRWGGAMLLAAIQIALLFVLSWLLRKKPTMSSLGSIAAGILLMPGLLGPTGATVGKAVVSFLTYAVFVGFGEEMLYRGYMQTRLNEAFGKPYSFFGVAFGWGAVLTALLFGLTHIGILRWILGLSTEATLAWGFWTTFGGLVFGFVREKSGSVLAPALLHGLPQAIATAVMLFLEPL